MIPVSVSVVKLGGLWQGSRVQVIRWGQRKGQGRWGHFNGSIMTTGVKNYEIITIEKIQNRKDGQNGKTANSKERGRKRENGKMLVSFWRERMHLMKHDRELLQTFNMLKRVFSVIITHTNIRTQHNTTWHSVWGKYVYYSLYKDENIYIIIIHLM